MSGVNETGKRSRVAIATLATGVAGLDEILGGGLPEYSFNLIVGTPGVGKTTLAHQLMFALATPKRPALYITLLGEPPLKMLRYQQQFAFFDLEQIGTSIRFQDLSEVVLTEPLDRVLERIVQQVEETGPSLVIVDSFQTVVRAVTGQADGELSLQAFVQRLAVHLTTWQATTFLIGEYVGDELQGSPVFTVADGILRMTQSSDRNSVVRKLQVLKCRGQALMPGLHTFRITEQGVQVFPRIGMSGPRVERAERTTHAPTGVAGLDVLLDGGIPAGDAVLVTGATGTGKSVLATQFIATGAQQGEPGVIAVFEERPQEYIRRAGVLGTDVERLIQQGKVEVLYLRPLDLSPDETLLEINAAVERIGARRVVIDSVSGFELALAPSFREDFRESLYRLVTALTGTGITVLLTMEVTQSAQELRLSPYLTSFLTDDIILLRYVELAGRMETALTVIKMRNSAHNREFWRFEITERGMIIRESLRGYQGVSTGVAEQRAGTERPAFPALTARETDVLRSLLELGEAPAAEVGQRSGLGGPDLAAALARLVALGSAAQQESGGTYRPTVRPLE
jgi:circadian clock protein KaiC